MAKLKNMLSTLFIIIFLSSGVAGDEVCADLRPSSSIQNMRYTGDVLTDVTVVGLQQCRTMCRTRSGCLGINYNQGQLTCELLSNSSSYDLNLLTSDSNFAFHPDLELEGSAQTPQTCQKNTCSDYQVCVALTSGQSSCQVVEGALCTAAGFTYNMELSMCVLFVPVSTSWTSASTSCESYSNGRLIVLDTPEKIAMLPGNTIYWVGATRDTAGSPHFSWLTSKRVIPQPSQNSDHEMCLCVYNGVFEDHFCSATEYYICELVN